jgi:hypothetical protein
MLTSQIRPVSVCELLVLSLVEASRVCGQFVLACPLEAGSFDLVSAVASLHHMGARAGLARLRDLVAPGVRWHRYLRWRYSLVWAGPR